MTPAENERFTLFLRESAAKAKKVGHPGSVFVKMINADGGYETAKRLLMRPQPSPGFTDLYLLGHPELTVEALVLETEWSRYFDEELLLPARERLQGIHYVWTPWVAKEPVGQLNATPAIPGGVSPLSVGTVASGLVAAIRRILTEYLYAASTPIRQHPLASYIREDLAKLVSESAGEAKNGLRIKASAGQGVWVRGPWVGLFNPIVTTSAQAGYYACLLFREDMAGVYLSLNQAMTEAKKNYKSDAKTALRARAANFRAMLGDRKAFPLTVIDLAPSSPSNDTAFYEAGNIFAKYYQGGDLPSEQELKDDLEAMLDMYDALVMSETAIAASFGSEIQEADAGLYEDPSRFRLHKRIERNAKLVESVKKLKGCTCEACGMNFAERYGKLGAGYIEAHHLKPIATLDKVRVSMDPGLDFAVLCANCHRMIHRSEDVGDVGSFKAKHIAA